MEGPGTNIEPPPPPYSETDIYSNAGSSGRPSSGRPGNSSSSTQPTPSVAGDSSTSQPPPPSVTSSSQSDVVVYTPPLTPRTTSTHDAGTYFPASSSSQAAEAYFESRPLPPNFFQDQHVAHTVNVTPSSRPDDFAYVEEWSSRDIAPQDWQTFLNFLLPAHTTTNNDAVLDRKLRAEEESIAGAASSSSSGRSHASAQLEHLRASQAEAATPASEARKEATAVVSEWNHGFFQPRSVWIRLVYEILQRTPETQTQSPMPGSWSQQPPPQQQPFPGPYAPPPHPPPGHMGHQPYPWGGGPGGPGSAGGGGGGPSYHPHVKQPGFSFAGIRMNDDGLYIGSSLAADRNGFRLGDLVADTRGFRYRDNVLVGPGMFSGGGQNREYPGAMYHGGAYHGGNPPPPGFHAQPPFMQPPHPHAFPGQQPQHQRRHSEDSDEDSDDSDDSDDGSSIGSLPDYDDLKGDQIPVYRDRLRTWLTQPERHVTKQDVRQLKSDIREARRAKAEYPAGSAEKRALKTEMRSLTQEFRNLRRLQRSLRRERKRERRARRRMERRARRSSDRGHGKGPGSWGGPGGLPLGMGMGPPPTQGMQGHLGVPGPWGGAPSPTGGPPFGFAPGFGGPGMYTGTPFQPQMPGAWRQDEPQEGPEGTGKAQETWVPQRSIPPSPAADIHESSQAMFKNLDEHEKQLARKLTELYESTEDKVEEAKEDEAEAKSGGKQPAVADKQLLEAEVEELQRRVETLRLKADEAFARELEQQERREAGGLP